MKLMPGKMTFFDMFDQQAAHLVAIAAELREMLHVFDRLPERGDRIRALESELDAVTRAVVIEMQTTFITPLDKEDIHALAVGLDDVADFADAAADRVLLYQISESTLEARQLSDLLASAAMRVQSAVDGLRDLRRPQPLLDACEEVRRLEKESDAVYRRALAALFNSPGADPLQVVKWSEIYARLESAIDRCQAVSNVVEGIHLKYS
jgi:uncharacterized protein Yka (UPF0111/DUF47 family)